MKWFAKNAGAASHTKSWSDSVSIFIRGAGRGANDERQNVFADLGAFVENGRALLAGQYIGMYPLPTCGLFALMALMALVQLAPLQVAITAASIIALVATLKRDALLWVAYMPVLSTLYMGQLDLMCLWLLRHESPISLALLTLKPQLGVLAIPALIRRPELRKPFAIACTALYIPATLVRPTWPLEWLRAMNDGRLGGMMTAITQVAPVAFVVLLVLSATKCATIKRVFWTFNPTIRWYDLAMRAGESRWLIPASWAAFALTQVVGGHPWPMALVGLV